MSSACACSHLQRLCQCRQRQRRPPWRCANSTLNLTFPNSPARSLHAAVQSNEVYPTPSAEPRLACFRRASDKRFPLGLTTTTFCPFMEKNNSTPKTAATLWDWVKAACAIIITAVVAHKIYTTPTTITVDFPTLLSLLLALFAVALSALFYFKATDTSNAFYDNTYKFTKDIAELLVKIESGFGERLRHLDEGYSSMRNYFQSGGGRPAADVDKTKEKIETEQQEIEKVRAERDRIIQQLIERSQLQQAEKDQITKQLLSKEEELTHSQAEISKLNRRLTVERVMRRNLSKDALDVESALARFTFDTIVRKLGVERVIDAPVGYLRAKFDDLAADAPRGFIDDLEKRGFFENGLTTLGAKWLKEIAEKNRDE